MARWFFEPGHTAAEFCVRHMMVTHVRGHFKNVHGSIEFDPGLPEASRVEATIDARGLWSGEPDRDAHLRSPDFLDVQQFPEITFTSSRVDLTSPNEALITGALTIRGITKPVTLDVHYLGQWRRLVGGWGRQGAQDPGGFRGDGPHRPSRFRRQWNSPLARGDIVVGNQVLITIDAEAILES